MPSENVAAVFGPMRPPFLLLVPACFLVGLATALYDGHAVVPLHAVLAFVGALATHISVNALNEYDDFRSGLDLATTRTPFSGGSGTLPATPQKARYALVTGVVSLLVVVAVGVFFIAVWGWLLAPLGLLGALVIVLYTRVLTRSPLLCLLAPGLGFGPLMVMGTHFVLAGAYSWTAFAASLVPFFLVSDLLLINQFPDVEPDRAAGRRHLIIRWGRKPGVLVYGLFLVGAYLSVVAAVLLDVLPAWGLLALATLILALPVYRGLSRHYDTIPDLIPVLGKNVLLTLVTPVLLAVGIFIA